MEEMTRRRFLVLAPVALGAIPAVLNGCGGSSGSSVDGTVAVQNGQATLSFSQFPKLGSVGGAAVIEVNSGGSYIVIRTGVSTASALSAVCTHAHCLVGYQAGDGKLICPCHGSEYSTAGTVLRGPAIESLATFPATVDATGITIKIA